MKLEKLITNKGLYFDDVRILIPKIFNDNRGYFYESYNKSKFDLEVKEAIFCQENHSFSKNNVLRGLHYQSEPYAQAKFVECLVGKVYDVVVDLRKNSATFLNWGGIELSEENHKQIWIPEGFAHGFYTLTDKAHLIYKVNNFWNKDSERTIIWNDSCLEINWPQLKSEPILSDKDLAGKNINDLSTDEFF
jgi:dTDP-4-dehydrorhamnose 3,5-epimerase